MYSCWWTLTKNYRGKCYWVSILREFTVLLMLTHSLFTLCRCQIFKDCIPVVEQANSVIHSALDDPDIPLSPNELRWLGCNVYNLGCVSYQRDRFTEGVPLLAIACEELRVWCFAGKNDEEILTRIVKVIWPNNPCNFSNILCGMKCLREFVTFAYCGNKQCYSLCTLHCM